MGGCCGSSASVAPSDTFKKGGDKDISQGPRGKRHCTDILCLILFFIHWGLWVFVTFVDAQDGNPTKLYRPRDFRGDYCGIKTQWNNGLNLENHLKLTFTMNVSKSVDLIAKQLVCSTVAEQALTGILSSTDLSTYRCACCKSACSSCFGSLGLSDFDTASVLSSTISGKMVDLTTLTNAASLFTSTGANGDFFSNIWSEATSYFNSVCLEKCTSPHADLTGVTMRSYAYTPAPDVAWKQAWDTLKDNTAVSSTIRNVINTQFTFQALPTSICPYHERYCVPFPGVEFTSLEADRCTFKMATDVLNAVGETAAQTFEELGANDIVNGLTDSFGSLCGDVFDTLDALIVVGVVALIVGMIFLVLMRFFVGAVVWCSIFVVLLIFAVAGGFLFIRSAQCANSGFFDTGTNMGTAVVLSASVSVSDALSGGTSASEEMTGNGADYRGVQRNTRTGKSCQNWADQSPHTHTVNSTTYPNSGLVHNYCRNPQEAPTIWCFTTDPEVRWELCDPLGVIRPECPEGYKVSSQTWRDVLQVLAYVVWGCGVLWIILICCLQSRIRLAIAVNKAAAMFLYNTPQALMVPLVQIVIGIIWVIIWLICISFMISQVPDDYTPKDSYASYSIAYGTADVAGKCTDQAISGWVWKDEGDLTATDDPCSGNQGNTAGITPRCWRCTPPRFIFDVRFAYSFFSLLWNNAFLIALGQCIIAGAVCVWFFAPRKDKAKQKSVKTSTWRALRYHTGSLAFGAFVLAVVQFLRYLAMYLERQAKAQKNKIMAIVMRVLQCCLWCLERFVKFLNKNAYIQVAIMGTNFCTSAKNAFFLITRNILRFGVVATLGSIIHFLGFLFITVATCVLGYLILQGLHPEVTPVFPMILYFLLSYLVAKLYMNVFGLAVDTMLQCFIATEEMGGDDEFVPSPLAAFVKKTESYAKKPPPDST